MAKKKPRLFLRVVRVSNDDEIQIVKSDDITVIKKSALGIVTGQTQTYRLDKDGGVIIPLNNWSDVYNINIKDKVFGKEYKILKSKFENVSNKDAWMRSYTQVLKDSRTPMRIKFYAEVIENNSSGNSSPRVINGIDYQIDYPVSMNKKAVSGKTETVSDLDYNHTYTKETPVIRDIKYRIYLVDKNKRPYNPHLKIKKNPVPLYLEIDKNKYDGRLYIAEYQLQTFLQFKIKTKSSSNTPNDIKVKLIDYKGKVVKTLKVNPKTGLTEKISADYKRKVQVLVSDKPVTARLDIKDSQGDVVPSPFDYLRTLTIPTIQKPTAVNKPKHEATLAANTRLPIVYDLESKELSVFKSNDYKNLVKNLSNVDKLMAKVHMHRSQVATALEARDANMLKTAEDIMIAAEKEAQKEIEQDFSIIADMKEIFLVKTAVTDGETNRTTIERRYVRREYFEDTIQPTRINPSQTDIPTPDGDPPSSEKPSLLYDPASFAKEALADRIKEISASVKGEIGTEGQKDLNILDYLVPSANEISDLIIKSDKYQVDGEAQWLRMVGSAGMNGSADWNLDDKIGIEGGFNANGKAILCEASINPIMALPSLEGWHLKATFEDGIKIDLGSLRLIVSCEISGFAGANIGIEGAGSIKIKDGAQKLVSAARDPQQTIMSAWDANKNMPALSLDYKGINVPSTEEVEQLQEKHNVQGSAAISAFIGAEGGIEPKGGIEWLPPETEDFVSFASISLEVAGSYGIGGSLDFYVFLDLRAGKFKIRAKAAACFGGGGKLGFVFEVDGGQIESFLKWTFYQLVNAGFRKVVHIANGAFEALTKLSVLYLSDEASLTTSLTYVTANFIDFSKKLDTDSKRHDLAVEIMKGAKADMLLCSTPNAKGILVYNISRHGWYSHALSWPEFEFSIFDGFSMRLLAERKKAIIKIFTTVTTYPEWDNVLQHMIREGEKSDRQANEAHVLRFLSYGINNIDTPLLTILTDIQAGNISEDNDTGDDYVDQYLNMLGRLIKGYYPKGVAVVANTDPIYEKSRMLAKADYISPSFYAANNPQQFDVSILNPRDQPANGVYHA